MTAVLLSAERVIDTACGKAAGAGSVRVAPLSSVLSVTVTEPLVGNSGLSSTDKPLLRKPRISIVSS
jgi:hypothetical protein